jgi:hypothetical protein
LTTESDAGLNAAMVRARAEGSSYETPVDIIQPEGAIPHAIAHGEVAAGPPTAG